MAENDQPDTDDTDTTDTSGTDATGRQADADAPSGGEDLDALRKQLADLTAERDKWKARSRQNEDRAKSNSEAAKKSQTLEEQVEALRREQAERDAVAVQEKADLAAEKLQSKLVRGGFSDEDAAALIDTIDPLRLLDDGKVSAAEIDKLAKTLTKIGTRPSADPDQGRRGGNAAPSMNDLIRQAAGRTRVG